MTNTSAQQLAQSPAWPAIKAEISPLPPNPDGRRIVLGFCEAQHRLPWWYVEQERLRVASH